MQTKRWKFSLLALLLLFVSIFVFAACTPEENLPDDPSGSTERVTFTQENNPYAGTAYGDYAALFDWDNKNTPIYYQFEGSYTEGYGSMTTPSYFHLNCYEDGTLYAIYDGMRFGSFKMPDTKYYGYWYNIDDRGQSNLYLYIMAVGTE